MQVALLFTALNAPFLFLCALSIWTMHISPVCCERCWDLGAVRVTAPRWLLLKLQAHGIRWWWLSMLSIPVWPCITVRNCAWEDSRTMYAPTKRNPHPNQPHYLCRECALDHHSEWDERWSEYYSGAGVGYSPDIQTTPDFREPGLRAAIRRWRGFDDKGRRCVARRRWDGMYE